MSHDISEAHSNEYQDDDSFDFGESLAEETTCAHCKKTTMAPTMRVAGDFVACLLCGFDCHTAKAFDAWIGETLEEIAPEEIQPLNPPTAADFLQCGINHMRDRAATYDKPEGERSMGKTVSAYNIITGQNMSEEQGWLFMGLLKKVRSQQGDFKADNYEDEAAYAGLRGECAARTRQQNEQKK
jgi:hypothetical protein